LPKFFTVHKCSSYIVSIRLGVENSQTYCFDINERFFSLFEEPVIKAGELQARLILTQEATSYLMQFFIEGFVQVECDRCLELCKQPVQVDTEIIANIGQETVFDTNTDNISIASTDSELDVSGLLYELIILSLPYQRIHNSEYGENQVCRPDMIEILNRYIIEEEKHIDPRWEKLQEINLKKQ